MSQSFLSTKSFHPQTRENRNKVHEAEQRDKVQKAKVRAAQKEFERSREALIEAEMAKAGSRGMSETQQLKTGALSFLYAAPPGFAGANKPEGKSEKNVASERPVQASHFSDAGLLARAAESRFKTESGSSAAKPQSLKRDRRSEYLECRRKRSSSRGRKRSSLHSRKRSRERSNDTRNSSPGRSRKKRKTRDGSVQGSRERKSSRRKKRSSRSSSRERKSSSRRSRRKRKASYSNTRRRSESPTTNLANGSHSKARSRRGRSDDRESGTVARARKVNTNDEKLVPRGSRTLDTDRIKEDTPDEHYVDQLPGQQVTKSLQEQGFELTRTAIRATGDWHNMNSADANNQLVLSDDECNTDNRVLENRESTSSFKNHTLELMSTEEKEALLNKLVCEVKQDKKQRKKSKRRKRSKER